MKREPKPLPRYEHEYSDRIMLRFDTEEGFITEFMIEIECDGDDLDVTEAVREQMPSFFQALIDEAQEAYDKDQEEVVRW